MWLWYNTCMQRLKGYEEFKMSKREKNEETLGSKIKAKMTKKNIIITIVVIAVIMLVVMPMFMKPKEKVAEIKTEKIERRDIAKSISATGTIETSNSKNFVSTLMGTRVKSVNVKEGQKVNPGDIICTLDADRIYDNINTINSSIATTNEQTQHSQNTLQNNLNDLRNKKNQLEQDKQKILNDAKVPVDAAQSAFNAANARYQSADAALVAPLRTQLQGLQVQKDELIRQKNELEIKKNNSSNNPVDNKIENQVPVGGPVLDGNLQVQINDLLGKIQEISSQEQTLKSSIKNAESQIQNVIDDKNKAEAALNAAKKGYSEIAASQKSIEANISTIDGQIKSLEDQIKGSNITKKTATKSQEMQKRDLNRQANEAVVKSDVSGVVTNVNVKKGDVYSNGVIATVEGCEEFIIESQIEEYDIPDIKEGMRVLIKTDATRDEELAGTVTYVATSSSSSMPTGTSAVMGVTAPTGGKATYLIKISLDTPNDRLRLGMNAKLSIITNLKEKVLSVPYDSIYSRDNGQKYIKVLKNKETREIEEIDINTGIEGTYYVEVISDKIQEGMDIVKPEVKASTSIDELLLKMGPQAGV